MPQIDKADEIFSRNLKRKCCLLMGYDGTNYCGMQRNIKVITIEDELLKALSANKYITDEECNHPKKLNFQRASRTDKGVSALRQCCSLYLRKFYVSRLTVFWLN